MSDATDVSVSFICLKMFKTAESNKYIAVCCEGLSPVGAHVLQVTEDGASRRAAGGRQDLQLQAPWKQRRYPWRQ